MSGGWRASPWRQGLCLMHAGPQTLVTAAREHELGEVWLAPKGEWMSLRESVTEDGDHKGRCPLRR